MSNKPTNVLISFISYDQDSYDVKKQDIAFMFSHRQALLKHGIISKEECDQRKVPYAELKKKIPDISACLGKDDIWRPTIALCMGYKECKLSQGTQPELFFDEIYLLHDTGNSNHDKVINEVLMDAYALCKEHIHPIPHQFSNAWDHSEVYKYLFHFFQDKDFNRKDCNYFVNIANGTNAIKNSLFLLTHERVIDAKRIMPHPWNDPRTRNYRCANGGYQIDDPAEFTEIYADLRKEVLGDGKEETINEGIETSNENYRQLLDQIAKVARVTRNPILLTGPTGAGKTQIAKNIFKIRQKAGLVKGKGKVLQHVNCATLGGDPNIITSILFGEVKGSHSMATADKPGLLELADGGVLFLDEIGTLGLDQQAMLLVAIEEKRFLPLGGTEYVNSDFLLVCGTNTNLWEAVKKGEFRRDLFERINLWHFQLPSLCERQDEIMHQCKLYLADIYPTKHNNRKIRFADANVEADFKSFIEEKYSWPGNFRELNAILERMCEMSISNRITKEVLEEEIARTRLLRKRAEESTSNTIETNNATEVQHVQSKTRLQELIGDDAYEKLQPIDRVQLDYVAEISSQCSTLEDLSHKLYGPESNRYKAYNMLKKYGLTFRSGKLKLSGK